ncbi:hypothetical protein [Microvirga ossetica]|nr:hypothetical protein [Microvirga ossetica]
MAENRNGLAGSSTIKSQRFSANESAEAAGAVFLIREGAVSIP